MEAPPSGASSLTKANVTITCMEVSDKITDHFRLTDYQKKALKKLHLKTILDLLYHFPSRYQDLAEGKRIADLKDGDNALVYGKLYKLEAKKAWKKKIPMATGVLEDATGKIDVVWFNQPYIAKMFPEGVPVKVEGKVGEKGGRLNMSNPEIERATDIPANVGSSILGDAGAEPIAFPVYPESRGITSRWFYYTVQKIFASGILDKLEDPIPPDILKQYNLPTLTSALVWVHTPKDTKKSLAARKRFAFEEVFFIQLKKYQDRAEYDAQESWEIDPDKKELEKFIKRFPFTPTKAQDRAVQEILDDFRTPSAMSRLLEGDVGSGKTYVAATTSYAVVTTRPPKPASAQGYGEAKQDFGNLQVAYMAPTEILAKQHFESFIELFKGLPIQIALITGSGCKKYPSKVNPDTWTDISRTQLLKWVKNGEIPILLGTHALIQKTVEFKHLAYVIIDEQHRFGTRQRAELAKKDTDKQLPHLLSMTATPIPRTLALTIYGDLDLTLLDEMPPGRKEVETKVVDPDKRDSVYEKVREELKKGRQAYVITPRIDEPDPTKTNAIQARSVKAEAKRLNEEVFKEYEVGVLHGKLTPKEKDKVMNDFSEGKINILVATSVVEVGVNVPNATTIIIEGAERFGLAQLHQLRGRVLRSTHQAYCYLFTDSKSKSTRDRLKALEKAKNGFELAERDLEFRGSGELYGRRQWGISDIGMEAIKNIKMVEAARKEARDIIKQDIELKKYPLLKEKVEERGDLHFE